MIAHNMGRSTALETSKHMDRGALFLDTFFKPDLIVRYLPDILKGMVVTIEIALLVVVTGIALGLALALRAQPALAASQPADHRVRRRRPRAAAARRRAHRLFRPAQCRHRACRALRCCGSCCRCCSPPSPRRSSGPASCRCARASGRRRARPGSPTRRRSFHVVLPQAVRLTVPPLTNRTIAITKNTALGTVIGVPEILNQATTAESFSLQRDAADDGGDRLSRAVHAGGDASGATSRRGSPGGAPRWTR